MLDNMLEQPFTLEKAIVHEKHEIHERHQDIIDIMVQPTRLISLEPSDSGALFRVRVPV